MALPLGTMDYTPKLIRLAWLQGGKRWQHESISVQRAGG